MARRLAALATTLMLLVSCATPEKAGPSAARLAVEAMKSEGVALVMDGCVSVASGLGVGEVFDTEASSAMTALLRKPVLKALRAKNIEVHAYAEPFTCGYRAAWKPQFRDVDVLRGSTLTKAKLPLPLSPAIRRSPPLDAAMQELLQEAITAIQVQYRDQTVESREPLSAGHRERLQRYLRGRYVLTAFAMGRTVSTDRLVQSAIVAFVGAALSGKSAGTFENAESHFALMDLDTGRIVWWARKYVGAADEGNHVHPALQYPGKVEAEVEEGLRSLWMAE